MSQETKKYTAEEVLTKIGVDRTLDFLFDSLGTLGILAKMTEHLADKREKLRELDDKQFVRANRMYQVLDDATKRCKLI